MEALERATQLERRGQRRAARAAKRHEERRAARDANEAAARAAHRRELARVAAATEAERAARHDRLLRNVHRVYRTDAVSALDEASAERLLHMRMSERETEARRVAAWHSGRARMQDAQSLCDDALRQLLLAYDACFFDSRLLACFARRGEVLTVVAWADGVDGAPACTPARAPSERYVHCARIGENVAMCCDWGRIAEDLARLAITDPAHPSEVPRLRQMPSGIYDPSLYPLQFVADLLEHALVHALVLVARAPESVGDSHSDAFRALYANLFHPHPSWQAGVRHIVTDAAPAAMADSEVVSVDATASDSDATHSTVWDSSDVSP